MRFNRYRIEDGKMKFSSKLVDDSQAYLHSMEKKEPTFMLFNYPEPKRMSDRIPGINMSYCSAKNWCDNIGTMAFLLPDKKTFVMTTDQATMLIFNHDDLSTHGFLGFEKGDYKQPTMGATHVVNDISTGDTIGLLGEMDIEGFSKPKNFMTFYRIKSDNIKNRIRIGSIQTDSMEYYHSFGHTRDYILMPKNSVTFSSLNMAKGDCVEDCFIFNWENNLEFNLMKIEDGTNKVFKVDHPGLIIHTGNTYIEDDIMTIDFEMSAKNLDPFKTFSMSWLKDNNRKGIPMGYVFRRYKIDLKTEKITFNDILAPEFNSYGFPMINPTF
jgi:carotenoid cleavage dioxygenase-like enzyme